MRRPLGHLGLILGSASLLFGCPGGDDSSGEGTTGGPTTDPTVSTSMSSTTPTTETETDPTDPGTSTGEETGTGTSTGFETGTSSGSGDGSGSSSGSGGGAGDLVVNLMGYQGPHDGQDVALKLFAEDDTEIDEVVGVINADPFTLTLEGVIQDGVNYNVRWWVDVNENGTCDPEPTDHMWEFVGEAGSAAGLTIDHPHDANWENVCPFWR